jgi:glycosyltransferase involved in cell wall biosynthesis
MKILLNLHKLKIGGAQLVAIRLAGALRERGHETVIYGPPGALTNFAVSRGLRFIPQTPPSGRRPSLRAALALRDLARKERADLVHASGHSVCIEAFYGTYLLGGIPLVCSIRGAEAVPRPYPKSIPIIFAHQYIAEAARQSGFKRVHLIRPPVDTDAENPAVDASSFLESHDLDGGYQNVVIVSRMAEKAKLEGLQRAIDAVELIAEHSPVRLIIVGDGIGWDRVSQRAEGVNGRAGRRVVILTGAMLDPRPAYAAGDVIVGMQGSILRGMAFQKAAIVLGEQGFSEIVTPQSRDQFLWKGFFGLGDGDLSPHRLADQLRTLLADEALRAQLGRFGRELVCEHASLNAAADEVEELYRSVVGKPPSLGERLSAAARFAGAAMYARGRSVLFPGETLRARRLAAWNQS